MLPGTADDRNVGNLPVSMRRFESGPEGAKIAC